MTLPTRDKGDRMKVDLMRRSSARPATVARASSGRPRWSGDARWGLAMSAPTLLVLFVLVILPVLWTVSLAFQHVTLINIHQSGFFGRYTLANFRQVVSQPQFLDGIVATLAYSVFGTVLSILLGLAAAMALRKAFPGRALIRSFVLLPYVAPVVAATYVWQVMLNPAVGLVNKVGTELLGWNQPVPFLSQQYGHLPYVGSTVNVPTALIMVILFDTWRYFPFAFLFLTARLQSLPADIEEAARVDGASTLQRFRYIILPQLRGVIALLVVLRFIWTFNKFDDVYLLTGGAAGTGVVSVRVYRFLTAFGNVGASSAEALILAVALGVFVVIYAIMQRSRTGSET